MDQRTLASRLALSAAACAFLPALASAQWPSLTDETAARIDAPPGVTNGSQEVDLDWADLDNNGYTDLVVVRKTGFTTDAGPATNVLLMNENGVLTDRTATHANKSDVPGDMGFLTPTTDRDVEIVDVDNDGWLDIVTATTLGGGQPQHISHPRVYMNLGAPGGTWLGFEHQAARFPQLYTTGGTPTCPKFCGMSSGDVTGDGLADLYFADYDTGGACAGDLNNRLMINDPMNPGHFVDESALRMTPAMLDSSFGTSAQIADFNMDGLLDIMDNHNSQDTAISLNDPSNPGHFAIKETAHNQATYGASAFDLNGDGLPDLLFSDDGDDMHRENMGPDSFGRPIWSAAQVFLDMSGGPTPNLGFAGNNLAADIDMDGHPDAIFCDVDEDIPGCNRRAQIFRNLGGPVGSIRDMQEQSGPGWISAPGLTASDLGGMHDIAAFDIDGDGDTDLVFGRCVGLRVWMNNLDPVGGGVVGTIYCACSSSAPCSNTSASGGCVNSTGSGALLTGSGSTSVSFNDLTLSMSPMANNEFGIFFTGSAQIGPFSFGDGQRCVGGSVFRFPLLNSGPAGALTLSNVTGIANANFGAGGLWSTGSTWNVQGWYRDPGGACGSSFNLSNGLSLLLTP